MKRLIRLTVILVVTAGIGACSKAAPEDTESESVVPVAVATATVGDLTARIHATGLVTPAPGAELIVVAPEAARIAEIGKAEGDVVHRGDVLVRFDIPSAAAEASKQHAEISRAQARLTSAQAAEARMKDLFERGVAARKEVEEATREVADAQADLAGARAAAQAAETMAARSVVHATFDGIVSRRSHNPGDLVGASDAVLRIVDPARLELVAQIPLADAPRIRMGAPARVAAATGTPGAALAVASRPAAVQEGTATIPVRLAFKQPAGYAVGTPLEVEIDGETHRQVVLVPTAAVVHEGDESAVFVVNADKAQRRVVMTGASDADHVEITQGIKAGETVIVTNQNGLPDGATISVEQR
jgi:RND family efflux transporter MFP subunit